MIDSKGLESSVNDNGNELNFQSAGESFTGHDSPSENEKHDAAIGNLHVALDIPMEKLVSMLSGDHFNHQY